MDMFVVEGGRRLTGLARPGGAKNAVLPIMAAVLAADGPLQLSGVPDLTDVRTLGQLLASLGVTVERQPEGLLLAVSDSSLVVADYELVRTMRASICVLGPLLARRRRACVSLPGGCNIGHRPIDLHLKGLAALGADIRVERGYVIAEADRLRGATVYLGGPRGSTVTGTCNVMTAATLAEGTTTIEAAACEPEVVDLGECLNRMGADIEGLGTPQLVIHGVSELGGTSYRVIPDRIEVATLIIAAAITGSEIELDPVRVAHLGAVLDILRSTGVEFDVTGSSEEYSHQRLHVTAPARLRATEITSLPYPGVPTDVQAQLMALLCLADGTSVVTDRVFPDRFLHAAELIRMGAQIHREGSSAVISGVPRLSGANVMASDLRASAALVLAALSARGRSVVRRIYHLDRGYERLDEKLNRLHASISRVADPLGTGSAGPPHWIEPSATLAGLD